MKVRMIKGLANHIKSYPKGSVQDLEKDFATSLIKNGLAELIEKPKRRTASSAKQQKAIKR